MKPVSIYNTVIISHSTSVAVRPGNYYTTLKQGNRNYLFDDNGEKIRMKKPDFQWKRIGRVVLMAKILSSLLDSVCSGKIYRVFNDEQNDERYILDDDGKKVLFDKIMFKYELI